MWGCTVSDYGLSLTDSQLWMSVYCLKGDRPRGYRIVMSGILSLKLDVARASETGDSLRTRWFYIELSSINADLITQAGREFWRVEAELWESRLEVICVELEVTEVPF